MKEEVITPMQLMLGSVVYADGKLGVVKEIAGTDAYIWCGETWSSIYTSRYRYKQLTPVRLASDKLKKLGFEERQYCSHSVWVKDAIVIHDTQEKKWVSIENGTIDVSNVHQFQLFLSIIGREHDAQQLSKSYFGLH